MGWLGPGLSGDGALGASQIQSVSLDTGYVSDVLAPGEVIFTFDDGPQPSRTRRVLNQLGRDVWHNFSHLLPPGAQDLSAHIGADLCSRWTRTEGEPANAVR